jgi:Transposase zinc-ribbon domain
MSAALRPVGPRAGVDYPTSLSQFLDWFHSDADCARYLARLRWPDGFSCPKCRKQTKAWVTKRYLYVCSECRHQTSLIAGTIFEKTRLPLLTWFRAAWMVSSSKGRGQGDRRHRRQAQGRRQEVEALEARAHPHPGRSRRESEDTPGLRRGHCEQGSTIYTDGLSAYKNLSSRGFTHEPDAVSQATIRRTSFFRPCIASPPC